MSRSLGNRELRYLNILPNGSEHWQEPHRKVFGRLNPAWTISPGNHLCNGVPAEPENYVHYRHYSIRDYEQFRRKMINYMTAFHEMRGWQEQELKELERLDSLLMETRISRQ